jgi:hypothetical protein
LQKRVLQTHHKIHALLNEKAMLEREHQMVKKTDDLFRLRHCRHRHHPGPVIYLDPTEQARCRVHRVLLAVLPDPNSPARIAQIDSFYPRSASRRQQPCRRTSNRNGDSAG